MVYSKPGYCQCGYEIWVEFLWNGQEWIYRFSDVNLQEITQCPDCEALIREDDLDS